MVGLCDVLQNVRMIKLTEMESRMVFGGLQGEENGELPLMCIEFCQKKEVLEPDDSQGLHNRVNVLNAVLSSPGRVSEMQNACL